MSILRKEEIKRQLRGLLEEFYELDKVEARSNKRRIALSCTSYGAQDTFEALDSLLGGWPTIGPKVRHVEKELSNLLGVKNAVMVSSGGAANFLALFLLSSPYVDANIRLRPGDEIITPAVTWSTTVSPIFCVGCVPVLVDVNMGTYDVKVGELERNITSNTKAVLLVHPLGHACEMEAIVEICKRHNLLLIEDTCESIGTKYGDRFVGTFGDISTFSFYFSHHITSVEGGLLVTDNDYYADVLRSMRANGWFRDLRGESLKMRILGENRGIDTSFLFPFMGFNFKPTDVSAGLLLHQIDRLEEIIASRTKVAEYLNGRLKGFEEFLHLPYQREPCRHGWFSYGIVVKNNRCFTKGELVKHLKQNGIDTRPIIAGNIVDQPFLRSFRCRKSELTNAENIMKGGFFLGCHQAIGEAEREFMADVLEEFMEMKQRNQPVPVAI